MFCNLVLEKEKVETGEKKEKEETAEKEDSAEEKEEKEDSAEEEEEKDTLEEKEKEETDEEKESLAVSIDGKKIFISEISYSDVQLMTVGEYEKFVVVATRYLNETTEHPLLE